MIDLDDGSALRAADPGGMLGSVTSLAAQCLEGHRLGLSAPDLPSAEGVSALAFCGMGSSALGGEVLAALSAGRLRLPIAVVRSMELPMWVGPHTLVVASSYSGSTAETHRLFEEAVGRGCRVVVIASGSVLAERAEELGLGRVIVPGGRMPRAAFGYMALGALGALEAIGVLPPLGDDVEEAVRELDGVIVREGPEVPTSSNPSKALALSIGARVPVIWGADGIAAVAAARWKTQLNENAKVPAFASALPELDHNEVVGWSEGRGEGFALMALRHEGEHPEVSSRFAPSIEIARAAGATTQEVWALGRSPLARLLTLVQVGDLVSTYLGIARGVDPSPIEAIVRLKQTLADV